MKLKMKSNGGILTALVTEAGEVVKELRVLDTPAAAKLTAPAFVAAAIMIAHTTPERLAKLRGEIEHPTGHNTGNIAATLRRMVVAIRSPNFPRPPTELRRLNYLTTPETVAELAALGSSTFELFALAAQIAAEKHPDAFGECTDSAAHDRQLIDLALKREELYSRISKGWGPTDVETSAPDSHGRVLQTFTLSQGQVSVHPLGNAGERLTNWFLGQTP